MKVLVTGSRTWIQVNLMYSRLAKLPKDTIVIVGDARGADTIAQMITMKLGLGLMVIRAAWHVHGKAAGPIRNKTMLDIGPDLIIAFKDNSVCKGTNDMIRQGETRGVPVEVITPEA